jgi:hypothetical protein
MPDKPTSHDALFAKMQALVGRHRAPPTGDDEEIPVLTNVVAPAPEMTETPTPPDLQGLCALLEAHLVPALTQQLSEQFQSQLQTQIHNAVREVLERESKHLATRIASRVSELVREELNAKR